MLKVRIIPTLLWKQFGLVKGTQFDSWRRVGSVLPAIKVYNQRDVDELLLLDISCTKNLENPDWESVAEFSRECFVPFTVGGGISTLDQVRSLLRSGADKIVINTAAYSNPFLVTEIANRFGSQCVVASVDVRRKSDGAWECFSHCGSVATGRDAVEWSCELDKKGVGELLITSIDNDGMMAGYDIDLIRAVTQSVRCPVIASGGAANYQHMIDVVKLAGASAVAAASMFHFTEQTPAGAKQAMEDAGIQVRRRFVPISEA